MKFSFSTTACRGFDWPDIYPMAKDLGFDGIEINGSGFNPDSFLARKYSRTLLSQTISRLNELGIELPCLTTKYCIKNADTEEMINRIYDSIDFAVQIESPYVSVLADEGEKPSGNCDDEKIADILRTLAFYAGRKNITILVETSGDYADSKRLAELLKKVNSEYVAALWDVNHTYRFFNEYPSQTIDNIGSSIKFVHIKDSVLSDGKTEYRLPGEGDIPLDDVFAELSAIKYKDYLSFEWIPKWSSGISDIGVVFAHFSAYAEKYRKKFSAELPLNREGTGKYIWRKNRLIHDTFPDVLDRVCREFPDQYAFRYTQLDYTRTYIQFRDDVDDFAKALIAMGVKKGDSVSVWAGNIPEWFISFWAVTKIGAVFVTVNTAYKTHETGYLLRQSDTHTLIMSEKFGNISYTDIIDELCPELENDKPGDLHSERFPMLKNIVIVGEKKKGCYTWDEAVELGRSVPMYEIDRMRSKIEQDDVCNMQYTSGTTGFPKGVKLTHCNVVNNGKSIGDCLDLSTADRMMIQVPMFHCFGMVLAMTACMTHGSTMSPLIAFSPSKALECINKEKITAFHGVPTMFIRLLEHPDFEKTDFSYMRTGIMAGSPCPVKLMKDVINKMHMSEICITYGLTEASPGCTMSSTEDPIDVRVNTVGKPMFGVECRIIDPKTGKELPDETDGEFTARGYNIMKGYYKMPEATAAAIDDDGWLHTGDLARRTKDGYYMITGRIKDMIIRGGENIYPKEIEEFLYTHPKVKDVQVIGVPDRQYGEEIMACIILKDGCTSSPEEIREFVSCNMARHKTPKYVDFVDEFPMNAAGKILKYKMRDDAVEKLGIGI